ncbi:MAG TPA: NADH-quinone oxidoreductase subunit K, partial [Actinobacteria bacterium]|nr:NADH-quinone oxidoreductase subunit K [Actinomycetota bacterium]
AFALVVLVIAAAEAAVGMALVVTAYRRTRRTRIDEFGEVSG